MFKSMFSPDQCHIHEVYELGMSWIDPGLPVRGHEQQAHELLRRIGWVTPQY